MRICPECKREVLRGEPCHGSSVVFHDFCWRKRRLWKGWYGVKSDINARVSKAESVE